jgi:RimJ/RimL family protein N-acetyltransferase
MTGGAFPARIELDPDSYLRQFSVGDAAALARSVRESLGHLRPWMPWANEQSADARFQRDRLRGLPAKAHCGEEWQYGLFRRDDKRVHGSFGLMTRMGAGTIEIGYWLHVDAGGRGDATRAAGALTDIALATDGIRRVYICCDEANTRSAAIPQRLGFTLTEVVSRPPEAPGEEGRLMLWTRDRD